MSHWKKHIFLFQTLDAAVQRLAGWDGPEFVWRTGAMGWGTSLGCKGEMLEPPSLGGGCTHGAQRMQSCWWDPAQPRVAPELRNTGGWSHPKQAGAAWEKPLVPQEGAETAAFVHGSRLSQRGRCQPGWVFGRSGNPPPRALQGGQVLLPTARERAARLLWGAAGAEGGQGNHAVGLGAACDLASTVHSCLAQLFRLLLPLQSDACEAAEDASLSPRFAPSSPPSVPQLQLPPSLLQRPEGPPSSFPSFLVAVSPGLHSALPRGCLQHRQIFSDTHIPLCSEQSVSSSAGIFGRSPYPQVWGPRAGFCSSQVLGAVPHLHWRLPAQLGALGLAPHSGHCC